MSSSIELEDVGRSIRVRSDVDGRPEEFVALEGLDLRVDPGEMVCVVGPSGCGKSTVLDLVAGLTIPTSGRVLVGGQASHRAGPGPQRRLPAVHPAALADRPGQRRAGARGRRRDGPRASAPPRAREYLDLVGSADFATRYPHELFRRHEAAGGDRAQPLATGPQVLLMDEPFGALDAQTREHLQEELIGIWRETGTTVVFITHDIEEAVFLGQRVAVMSAPPGPGERGGRHRPGPARHRVRTSAPLRSSRHHRHEIWSLLRSAGQRARLEEVERVA